MKGQSLWWQVHEQIVASLKGLLGPADEARVLTLLRLSPDSEGKVSLERTVLSLFPDKAPEKALADFRAFKSRFNAAAKDAGSTWTLEVDEQKTKSLASRWCRFRNEEQERALDFSLASSRDVDPARQPQEGLPLQPGQPLPSPLPPPPREVRFFISYAHGDKAHAERFREELRTRLASAGGWKGTQWWDDLIEIGEDWDRRIRKEAEGCDYGILLLSPKFFASRYVRDIELPLLASREIPVMLRAVPLDGTVDLRGLNARQIFLGKGGRAFADCTGEAKVHWMNDFFSELSRKVVATRKVDESVACEDISGLSLRVPSPPRVYLPEFDRNLQPSTGRRAAADQDLERPEARQSEAVEALAHLEAWATRAEGAPYFLLLGELGVGKTTNVRALTHRLAELHKEGKCGVPIYLDLRFLQSGLKDNPRPNLDEILEGVIGKSWSAETKIDPIAVKTQVRDAGAIVIFDGLDEVLVHMTPGEAGDFIRQLWTILPPKDRRGKRAIECRQPGKVLMTCRDHYFPRLKEQWSKFFGEDREGIPKDQYEAMVLLPFDESRIRSYLAGALGGEGEAAKAWDLIRSTHDLTDLAKRPYLLSLIAANVQALEAWRALRKPITSARFYELLVERWLGRDDPKHAFPKEHKWRLMEAVAAKLWTEGRRSWTAEEMHEWLAIFLREHATIAFRAGAAGTRLFEEDLRTSTFLVREGEDRFRFAHASLHEFFLGRHLLRAVRENRPEDWAIAAPSPETFHFLGQLIVGTENEEPLLRRLKEWGGEYRTRTSENLVRYHLQARPRGLPNFSLARFDLAGASLEGLEVTGQPGASVSLAYAKLIGADLRRTRWRHVDLNGVDLSSAVLDHAEFHECRAREARFDGSSLVGSIFRRVDLSRASFERCRFHRAQSLLCDLQGAHGLDQAGIMIAPAQKSRQGRLDFQTFMGVVGPVRGLAMAVGGQRLFIADGSGVQVLDTPSGQVLRRLALEGPRPGCLSVDEAGALLVTGGDDGIVRLWDARAGKLLHTLSGHKGGVCSCALSADGTLLATGGDDGTARLWEARTGKLLHTLEGHEGDEWSCALSADGTLLATWDGGTARLWDARTRELLHTLKPHKGMVWSCALSADGTLLATGGDDGTARLWEARTGKLLHTLEGGRAVSACALNADGTLLATGATDGTTRLWDVRAGELLHTLEGRRLVSACALSADGTLLATGGNDGTARLWDARTGGPLHTLEGASGVSAGALSADGTLLATWDDVTARLWDVRTGELLHTLGDGNGVSAGALSANGRFLVTGGSDGTARLWEARTGKLLHTLNGRGRIWSCALSADGTLLATGGDDGTARLWDARAGKLLHTLGGGGQMWSCALSADGSRLVTGGVSDNLLVWDVRTGELLHTLRGPKGIVWSCALSADGTLLATGGDDGIVRLWDARAGKLLHTLKPHKGMVWSCALSADGTRLVTGGDDGGVRLWDARSGELLHRIEGPSDWAWSCALSADGAGLLIVWNDGSAHFYDRLSEAFVIHAFNDGSWCIIQEGLVTHVSEGSWRWLGWLVSDEETGEPVRWPFESFAILPVEERSKAAVRIR